MQSITSSPWRRPAAAVGAFVATLLVVLSIGGSAGAAARSAGQDTGELANTGVPIELLVAAGALLVIVGIAGVWIARTSP